MTSRKRVNLSLSIEEYEALMRYSNTVNQTPTAVIHQVIQEVIPSLEKLTKIAIQAQSDRRSAISEVQGMAMSKISELSKLSSELPTLEEKG